jgi:hypothetical protein
MKTLLSALMLSLVLTGAARAVPSFTGRAITQFGVGISSLGQAEVGLFNVYGALGSSERYGFYNKGRAYNFLALTRERDGGGREVDVVSYEALFPGLPIFMTYFTVPPEDFGWLGNAVVLLNGELGVRTPWMTVGVTNGIHPFFTRRWYHDAGVRLGFGKSAEVGVTFFEQDRFKSGSVRYGIKLDVQAYVPM